MSELHRPQSGSNMTTWLRFSTLRMSFWGPMSGDLLTLFHFKAT
jgi:hypothetical protein